MKLFAMALLLVLVLGACGRNRGEVEGRDEGGGIGGGASVGTLARAENAEVLTVYVPAFQQNLFNNAAGRFMMAMEAQGRDVYVDILTYMHHERDEHYLRLLGMFAAGIGPDIFMNDFAPMYRFIENGFLADLNALIPDRTVFFDNVLEGMEIGGRLYSLPMEFGFDFVGINENMPASVVGSFAALDRISPSDMVGIFSDLIENYPEFAEFAFASGFHWSQAFMTVISGNLDFANRTINITDDETIAYFEKISEVAFEHRVEWEHGRTPEEMLELQRDNYVFHINVGGDMLQSLFEFQEPFFMHYIPLADEHGRVVNSRTWGANVSVSHVADSGLAWAFIEFLLNDDSSNMNFSMPIMRGDFRETVQSGIRNVMMFNEPRTLAVAEHIAIENAVNTLENVSQMPSVTLVQGLLRLPLNWEHFSRLVEGEISVYEAAALIEADILEWMNEVREVEEYVPQVREEIDFNVYGLPLRVLTVFSEDRYAAVIEQAALVMNHAWRERDEPYFFHVEVEAQNMQAEGAWNERHDRFQRLQVEMMAGGGPDMFVIGGNEVDRFPNHMLLQDFYGLIDNCPTLSRDDFFMQPLRAFERQGRLSFLPVSFGLMYTGINTGIPEEFVQRYSQKSYLSILEMMEFKNELMDAHGDDFPQFTEFNMGTFSVSLWQMFDSVMGSFIDFENRVSNLDDPRFAEALVNQRDFSQRWDSPSSMTRGDINTQADLRGRAREQIFNIENWGLSTANAFFSHETPYFSHYVPLADHEGRFLMDTRMSFGGEIWAIVCISARADGALAWEFTQHLIYAFTNPEGRAAFSVWGSPVDWGSNSLATPVLRSLFESHTRQAFYNALNRLEERHSTLFPGQDDPAERSRMVNDAMARMLAYYEMPMGLLTPNIPWELIGEHRHQFEMGVITAEIAAQRMHNAIALWLIE
ncbi:MAG: hypothetical protein FWB80_13855 [Defluviitaleaceae bacterium]|nr:hypothetical protein [Defluviitaleaceae bacterium]